eukprot:365969-Chlamydomonas_euryale.AAC.16
MHCLVPAVLASWAADGARPPRCPLIVGKWTRRRAARPAARAPVHAPACGRLRAPPASPPWRRICTRRGGPDGRGAKRPRLYHAQHMTRRRRRHGRATRLPRLPTPG